MILMRNGIFVAAAAAGVLLAATQARAVPVFLDYDVAGTGQTARAGSLALAALLALGLVRRNRRLQSTNRR